MRQQVLSLAVVVLTLFNVHSAISQTSSAPLEPKTTMQGLEGGFWRTDAAFDPILRLKNILLKQDLTISPSLFLADGTEYKLAPLTIEAAGTAQINIRYALERAPDSVKAHLSEFGFASITYQWSWPAIVASIQNTDEIASLTFTSSFQADVRHVHSSLADHELHISRGTWWLPTKHSDMFVVLGNASSTKKDVQVFITGREGNVITSKLVRLSSHATQLVLLSEILDDPTGTRRMGAIEVHYSGAERSVVSYAGISDESVGYSASPVMMEDRALPARPDHIVNVSAPGLMLGKADTEMGFPVGTVFTPYAFLHNVSSEWRHVTVSLTTQAQDGRPASHLLGYIDLVPGGVSEFDLDPNVVLPDGYGSLTVSFQGQDGDVRLQTGSVDQTNNYVFEVPSSLETDTASRTLCFWSVENDNNTMISVWNYEWVPQHLRLTLHFAGGTYTIPIELAARQSYDLDLRSLIASRKPDSGGNLIPSYISSGSAVLSNVKSELDTIAVVVASSVFNVRNATCGYTCISCNGGVSLSYSNSPVRVQITHNIQATVQLTMGSGTVYSNPAGGTWSTSNQVIATVNSNGQYTGVHVGTTGSQFLMQNVPVNATICGPAGSVSCPFTSMTAYANIYVQPVILSVDPLAIYVGQTGQFVITGQGLSSAGTISAQITGNDIQGGTSTSSTDTTAIIPFTVNCDAKVGPYGQLTVSMSQGDGGGLLTLPFNLSVLMPAPPAPSVQLNGQPISGTQPAVIGQQITLSGTQSLPRCMNLASQRWTPPNGNAVGGFTGSVSSGSFTPINQVNATGSNYSFYWVAPGNPLSSSYQYQMSASDYSGVTSYSGYSQPATASFNVSGPTGINIVPSSVDFFIQANPPRMNWRIQFNGSATSPGGYPGTYTWIQLVSNFSNTWLFSNGNPPSTCSNSPGFDAGNPPAYPYATGLTAIDGPKQGLEWPPTHNENEVQQAGSFQMYLMWNPNIGSSIPVPLAVLPWSIAADIVWDPTTQAWVKKAGTTNATIPGTFALTSTYPTWTSAAGLTCQ